MAKTKISEFSTTPGNNTDINGINIAEGCAPSGINNAIRELMSDLKEWQSGAMDVYVIPQGTAAAPGIQLYGDLDTGLYGYAANQLGVAVGGASAGYFSSSGWVGNVNGTITGDINATTIDTTNLEVTNIKAKDGTAAITIADSTGVVSVSTTLDLTTVEVTNIKAKDGTAAIALTDSTGVVTLARTTSATNSVNEMLVLEHYSTGTISAGFGSGIKFFGENTGGGGSVYAAIHAVWEGGIGDPSGGALVFLTDGYIGDNTERVRITSEGKVGIGTATPSATLEVAGSATVTGAATLSATTQNIALGTSQTTGTWTAGGASQTGALTLDQSTKTHTLNLGTGATESGLTKTINLGTGGVSTSTTAINIGSANGTTTTLNGTVTAATLNSTTIDTTNIEVTNIKAKDGSASATIADSTGVMTIASSVLTTTDINGGTIDGTTIGGSTAAAGTFTTATATTGNITTVNATTVDTTNLEVTNIKAKDGTAALSIADSTGVVSVSANPVLSGGTANGVVYLNASKVATSGTALTFDGTTLKSQYLNAQDFAASNDFVVGFRTNAGTQVAYLGVVSSANNLSIFSTNSLIFNANSTERMRLDASGNLLVGATATADSSRLFVSGNLGTNGSQFNFRPGSGAQYEFVNRIGAGFDFYVNNAGSLAARITSSGSLELKRASNSAQNSVVFNTTVQDALTLDSSGNLGLGVTPSAWTNFNAFQVGTITSLSDLGYMSNGYYGSGYKYIGSDYATRYQQTVGEHRWYIAPSGTAGNAISFTQAMTLDADGDLGIGTTSPQQKLQVHSTGTGQVVLSVTNADTGAGADDGLHIGLDGSENALFFNKENTATIFGTNNTERARITSGGYFKASNNGTYLNSTGSYHEFTNTEAATVCLGLRSNNASFASTVSYIEAARNTTNNTFYAIDYYNTGAAAYKFRVADSGDVTNTNGTYGTISDAKMKTDIVDAGSQWSDIKALRFRKFKMKDDPSGLVQLGVVAQEVELTSPGLVDEHTDRDAEGNDLGTTTKSVKTSVLLMKAAVALQEAMARIEKLEAEVAALKGV